MDRVEADATPAEEWLQSLNAACNRLMTQYLNLFKAGAGPTDLAAALGSSSSAGGGAASSTSTSTAQDPPPPPLAATVALSTLQCQLAAENICVACANLLSLIRTVRLSLLLMDHDTIRAEEADQVERTRQATLQALEQAAALEQEWMELQRRAMMGEDDDDAAIGGGSS